MDLTVSSDGLRSAAVSNEGLAAQTATPASTGIPNGQATGLAVQAVNAAIAASQANHAQYLDGHSQALASASGKYQDTDGGNAHSIAATM